MLVNSTSIQNIPYQLLITWKKKLFNESTNEYDNNSINHLEIFRIYTFEKGRQVNFINR